MKVYGLFLCFFLLIFFFLGVEVAVLLKEKENGGFKISMRSKDNVNVSDICLLLGGGGHPRAAGCFITGDVSQAKTKVINTIKQQINK